MYEFMCTWFSIGQQHKNMWSGQISAPHPEIWISTVPGLKLACISSLPAVTLLISTQTLRLPVRQIPVSDL